MEGNLLIGLFIGAASAGAAVFFYVKSASRAEADRRVAEAQSRANTDADRIKAEAETARADAERIRKDAEHVRLEADRLKTEAEAARSRADLDADATRKRAELELDSSRQKIQVEARELAIKARQEAEAALAEQRLEVTRHETRIAQKESQVDRRVTTVDERETEIARREARLRELDKKNQEDEQRYKDLIADARMRLEKASGLSAEDAKKEVIQSITDDAKREASKQVKRIEEEAEADAQQRANRIIGIAIQRYGNSHSSERTVTSVQLQSDEQKGRIIGREGRNIRALEQATGIDIVIDDTPEAIVLSGYNPVRREVARRAIEELLKDGRIHPARIEEVVKKHGFEVEASLKDWGEKALIEIGISGVHPEIVKLLGSLKYRTSYTQNQWQHALEVGFVVGAMAAELKQNVKEARRAGLLHDLGKAVSHEVEGGHAVIGADIAKKFGENERIVHAIRAHHDDEKPHSVLAFLVAAGDAISGARPGARSENLDGYVKRLEDLERISMNFPGVERAFAVQAGREMRVLVDNARVSDEAAVMLSRDIARQIEAELTYPGQIRVTVIRETRAVDIAR